MTPRRIFQVNRFLQKEIAQIIEEELEDLRGDFVTVSAVRTDPNLKEAKVYITSLSRNAQKIQDTVAKLQNYQEKFQNLLIKKINLRRLPKLIFTTEANGEKGDRVEELLSKIQNET